MALLNRAGLGDRLLKNIRGYHQANRVFFDILIPHCIQFSDTVDEVEKLLVSSKNDFGGDKLKECERLIKQLRSEGGKGESPDSERKSDASFGWLHLTDLHCGLKDHRLFLPGIREDFFDDLEKLREKSGPWDMVLFTGDLANRATVEEFDQVNRFLDQLWKRLQRMGPVPVFLAVPGNHDLVRPKKETLLEKWPSHPEAEDEFYDNLETEKFGIVTEAFENYVEWWKKIELKPENVKSGIMPGDFSVSFEKNGKKLGIVGLNTSFLQLTDADYKRKLSTHVSQFHGVCNGDGPAWAKQNDAWLIMSHHPPEWLNAHSERHLTGEILSYGHLAAHLCGHLHEARSSENAEGNFPAIRTWVGRSIFGSEYIDDEKKIKRLHGYSAGKIDVCNSGRRLTFWPREIREHRRSGRKIFVPDHTEYRLIDEHTEPVEF